VQIRSKLHKKNAFFNATLAAAPAAGAVTVDQVVSLREVPVPEPMAVVWNPAAQGPIPGPDVSLNFQPLSAEIVKDQTALIQLGKALFWDIQVGSDGVTACATCHYSAGADVRDKNQISPNLSDANFKHNSPGPPPSGSGLGGDALFGNSTVPYTANDPNFPGGLIEPPDPNFNRPGHPTFAPNYRAKAGDFPLNDWFSPTELTPRGPGVTLFEEMSNVSRDTNDIFASQGVRFRKFLNVVPGSPVDNGSDLADIWNTATPGVLNLSNRVRRAMPRNSPTMINAVFNFDNLWEGRASFIFNGVNNSGFRDRTSKVMENINGTLTPVFLRITNSSLASVAVGPPTSNIAMSFNGRTMKDVGLKMTNLRPLVRQYVHPNDSALGPLSRATLSATGGATGARGLKVHSYCEMIQAAFQDQWWNPNGPLALVPVATHSPVAQSASIDSENSHSSSEVMPEFSVTTAHPAHTVKIRSDEEEARAATATRGAAVVAAAAAPAPCIGSEVLPKTSTGATQYTQMQANFTLFFGLAVQAYMGTLVSDDTPFDRFNGAFNPVRQPDGSPCPAAGCTPIPPDPTALTDQQSVGLTVFLDDNAILGTHCADCHIPPVTTGHTVLDYQPDAQGVPSLAMGEAIEFMIMGDNQETANYDHGMYNIGVRRSSCGELVCGAEDKGRGANAPSAAPTMNPVIGTIVPIASISRTANVVTVNTATANPLATGQFVTVAGVTDKHFNGTFAVTAVNSPTQFTYSQILADSTSTGGSAIGPNKPFPVSLVELTALREDTVSCATVPTSLIPHIGCLPSDVARFIPDVPILPRRVTNGAFKAPNLRNIKYSGPYFHVGDSATLRQVVEFYTRGGNFPNTNLHDKTVDVEGIPPLMFPEFDPVAEQYIESLVEFLANGLTDKRVAFEQAPFDHPQIMVPNGSPSVNPAVDTFIFIPAVGAAGRATELPTFLNLDPQFSGPP
jgi:cytochrome c peroxidase